MKFNLLLIFICCLSIVVFTLAGADSLPGPEKYTLSIDNRAFPWMSHPDASVDLSVLPLAPALRHMEKQGKKPLGIVIS